MNPLFSILNEPFIRKTNTNHGCIVAIDRSCQLRCSTGTIDFLTKLLDKTVLPENAGRYVGSLEDTAIALDESSGVLWILRGGASKTRLYFSWQHGELSIDTSALRGNFPPTPRKDLFAFVLAESSLGPVEVRSTTETAMAGIYRAPPASLVCVRIQSPHQEIYEILHPDATNFDVQSQSELLDELHDRVSSRIKEAMTDHQMIGVELSGGIDSMIAGSLCQKHRSGQQHAFGITLTYPYYEFRRERRFITDAYSYSKLERILPITDSPLPFDHDFLLPPHSEPNLWTTGIRQSEIIGSTAKKAGVSLLFNGHGGDPLFGFGVTEKIFAVPEFRPPSWIGSQGRLHVEEHLSRVRSHIYSGSSTAYRAYFSGIAVDDGWGEELVMPNYGITRCCIFTDPNLLGIASRLFEIGDKPGLPYKWILRSAFKNELPESIMQRPHKVAYDGTYFRAFKKLRDQL